MKSLLGLLIVLLVLAIIFVPIFYGIWKLGIKMTHKKAPKFTDKKLMQQYKTTAKNQRIILGIVLGVVCAGLGGIFLYYMFKKQHQIFEDELIRRNITFDKMP